MSRDDFELTKLADKYVRNHIRSIDLALGPSEFLYDNDDTYKQAVDDEDWPKSDRRLAAFEDQVGESQAFVLASLRGEDV